MKKYIPLGLILAYIGCASINNQETIRIELKFDMGFFYENGSLENKFSNKTENFKKMLEKKGVKVSGDYLGLEYRF